MRASPEAREQFLNAQIGQVDPAWVEEQFSQSAAAQEAATSPTSASRADREHSAMVALACGPVDEEVDWEDDVSICSVESIPDEVVLERDRKRRLQAAMRQAPQKRKSKVSPVDEEFIGVQVEQTQYRRALRRKQINLYIRCRHFTDRQDRRHC